MLFFCLKVSHYAKRDGLSYHYKPSQKNLSEEKENIMALSRSLMKGMGLTEEQITAIIEGHSETVEGLKAEVKELTAKAEKLPNVEKELATLKAKGDDGWQKKYEDEHSAFEAYKADQKARETKHAIAEAYKKLLLEAGISEKRIESILKVTDLDTIKIDEKGAVTEADKLKENITKEWSDFIESTEKKGANTKTPPENNGGGGFEQMSLDKKMEYANAHPEDEAVKAWLT